MLEQAGKGGMGTVYIAEQLSPRRTVAMKLLSRAPNAETLAKFRREAEAIAGLEHPRIVPLYSYGEENGIPYLVMRYLSGGSLADRIPMDLAPSKRWLEEIASALDYAHGRGLVHRDVKPSNILLDEQGRAYLSDFGIAGTLADIDSSLPTGSAAYMAPEQGRGEGIDSRADIYSLAVTLFETLTGQQPYTAESALGVIARHMHYPVPSARELNRSIPPAVDQVVQQGMAKAPGDRPDTAGEFARLVIKAPLAGERALVDQEPTAASGSKVEPSPTTASGAMVDPGLTAASETLVDQELTAASGSVVDSDPAAPGQAQPRRKWLIGAAAIIVAGIAIIGGGALLGARTQTAEQPQPTATLPEITEPLNSPSVSAQSDSMPNVLLADDFSAEGSGFAVLSDDDGGVQYAEGALEFTAFIEGVRWYSPSSRVDEQDVVIETSAQLLSGPALSELALLCRWRDLENFTALAVRADGSTAIWQLRDGETYVLKDWSPEFSGFSDAPIAIRATCRGEELILEAAGRIVAEAIDAFPNTGDVALMAGLGAPGELKVLFDNLRVDRPQGTE